MPIADKVSKPTRCAADGFRDILSQGVNVGTARDSDAAVVKFGLDLDTALCTRRL
jgi:hypothetical protein